MAAAVVSGWIESEAPEDAQEALFQALDGWLETPDTSAAHLWQDILNTLERGFYRDGAVLAAKAAVVMLPGQPYLRIRLARALHLTGHPQDALDALVPLTVMAGADPAQIQLRLELAMAGAGNLESALGLAESWVGANPRWDSPHAGLLRAVGDAGGRARMAALLQGIEEPAWPSLEETVSLARARLDAGDASGARALFSRLSKHGDAALDLIVGRALDHVPAYDDAIEARILGHIHQSRTGPENEPTLPPPSPLPPSGLSILLAGFAVSDFPNDVVQHMLSAAHACGLDAEAWLDDALTMGATLKATDAEIESRLTRFEDELEERRPDLLVLDWATPITRRSLTPERLASMKQRLGFRLAVTIRDAHGAATPIILAWAEVADVVVLFHPLAPAMVEAPPRLRPKLLPLWIPVEVQRQRPWAERSMTLAFAGSTAFTLRNALLSVLLTEDLPLTALTREERLKRLSTMADYMDFLGDARAVLNISAHTHDEHLVTGRVWEATACGTLLVEQDNPATACCLTPWRHFLPWRTVADIAHFARFVQRRPEEAQVIAAEAAGWVARHYTAKRFWHSLIDSALRT